MNETISQVIAWLAPITSTLIVTALTAQINQHIKAGERKRDEARVETEAKRAADAEWRAKVDGILSEQERALKVVADDKTEWHNWRRLLIERLDEQDKKMRSVLEAQCSQMRSDILHKCHRYMDDLQCASIEEKDALREEYKDYEQICAMNDIENEFIAGIVKKVMDLPNRSGIDKG